MSRMTHNAFHTVRQRTQLSNRQRQNQLSCWGRQQTWYHNAGAYYLTRYVWKSRK
jgi:hypothetical protein